MVNKDEHAIAEDPLLGDDEDYHSSEDEDFEPDKPVQTATSVDAEASDSDDSSSDSDDEIVATDKALSPSKTHSPKSNHKKKRPASDIEIDNSGDEAVIKRGKHKKNDPNHKSNDDLDDDEGGEGGLIKTRAQRAREKVQQTPIVSTKGATVDVDALWKSLNAPEPPPPQSKHVSTQATITDTLNSNPTTENNDAKLSKHPKHEGESNEGGLGTSVTPAGDGMVTIRRTYKFAGEVITEEKTVSSNSYEARAHTSSTTSTDTSSIPNNKTTNNNKNNPKQKPLRRPIKRKSRFEVDPSTIKVPTKLTTLEKSRLDWAGYVDKAGIGDELDKQKKGGAGYLDRKDFLGRVEHRTNEFGKGR